jgi:hypothetical protein
MMQELVVGAVLVWSVVFMLRRFLPAIWREDMAAFLRRRGWARLSLWLAPAAVAGCGSGCATCSPSCASQTSAVAAVQPVQWRGSGSSDACH